jgi:hypothetical protein
MDKADPLRIQKNREDQSERAALRGDAPAHDSLEGIKRLTSS